METVSIILSIVALIISVATPAIEYLLTKRLNRNDAISNYLREVLSETVFTKLPEAVLKIHLSEDRVTETDEAIDVLRKIRKSILFYQHIDKKFYEEYKKLIQELEDLLVKTDKVVDDEYVQFRNEISDYLNKIYQKTAEHLF